MSRSRVFLGSMIKSLSLAVLAVIVISFWASASPHTSPTGGGGGASPTNLVSGNILSPCNGHQNHNGSAQRCPPISICFFTALVRGGPGHEVHSVYRYDQKWSLDDHIATSAMLEQDPPVPRVSSLKG